VAQIYTQLLTEVAGLRLVPSDGPSVRHLFPVRSARREALRRHLTGMGIETGIHYPHALHEQPAFAAVGSWAAEPVAAVQACREVLSLPIGPHVDAETARWVAEGVRRFAA
jgi:dTDP-4-amino-4,6-dideoxygalactose transaminase